MTYRTTALIVATLLRVSLSPQVAKMPKFPSTVQRHGVRPARCFCCRNKNAVVRRNRRD
jgi:hypothetical protein